MQWDFSKEKIIASVVAVGFYFLSRWLDAPYWLSITSLVVIIGWGPEIWQRFRR